MTVEEKIKKAEQEMNRAKNKLAEAKREASIQKRKDEDRRKFMMGGLVAKYLREEMELYFMDFSEEEITRIVACGMKQRDTQNLVKTLISNRPTSEPVNADSEDPDDEEEGGENE